MLDNNNKDVIKRLYKRMLKQNRLRNNITILAIVLTTFMFTAVFTMGFSLVNNTYEMLLMGQTQVLNLVRILKNQKDLGKQAGILGSSSAEMKASRPFICEKYISTV